jgi:hypothetical protein
MYTAIAYCGAFLIGAVAGFLAAAEYSRRILARRTGELGELLLPLYVFLVLAGVTFAGGLLGVFLLSLWRGEALLGLLICAGIVAALFAVTLVRRTAYARYERRPDVRRQREEREMLRKRRNALFEDYSRFLHAAGAGDISVVRSLLDVGMPYVAPSPGVTPRYPLGWAETTVETPEIQNGISIFRYSALELAAWYGRTEIVALLLTCERDSSGRSERRERALTYARRYGCEETTRLLEQTLG